MEETAEKAYRDTGSSTSEDVINEPVFERPTGFKGAYCHPLTQVSTLLHVVCAIVYVLLCACPGHHARLCLFYVSRLNDLSRVISHKLIHLSPGLFNALNGLGAGGQVDSTTSANANSALYATFAAGAFFSG